MQKLVALSFMSLLALTGAVQVHAASHSSGTDHSTMHMSSDMVEGAVHAKGKINSIGDGTVNVSHDPIPAIGWPAMTMDLPLMEGAEIKEDLAAGDEVIMMLIKGNDGMYGISALMTE